MTNITLSNKNFSVTRLFSYIFILIGLTFTSFLLYWSSLQVGFIGDDFVFTEINRANNYNNAIQVIMQKGMSL
jgi:hypothetical protein